MIVIDSNVYSASISRNKNARLKCASCMNHICAITLFGQACFTPARFTEYQLRHIGPKSSAERGPQNFCHTRIFDGTFFDPENQARLQVCNPQLFFVY